MLTTICRTNDGENLLMTVSMLSIEFGTIGGGTVLGPLGSILEMLGINGAHYTSPGLNAQRLTCIIATSVMAGELSLLSALAAGHLMRAHLVHNHLQANTPTSLHPWSHCQRHRLGAKDGQESLGRHLNLFSRIRYRRHLYGRKVYHAKDLIHGQY